MSGGLRRPLIQLNKDKCIKIHRQNLRKNKKSDFEKNGKKFFELEEILARWEEGWALGSNEQVPANAQNNYAHQITVGVSTNKAIPVSTKMETMKVV